MPFPMASGPRGLNPGWGQVLSGVSVPRSQRSQAQLGPGSVPKGRAGDRHVPTMETHGLEARGSGTQRGCGQRWRQTRHLLRHHQRDVGQEFILIQTCSWEIKPCFCSWDGWAGEGCGRGQSPPADSGQGDRG